MELPFTIGQRVQRIDGYATLDYGTVEKIKRDRYGWDVLVQWDRGVLSWIGSDRLKREGHHGEG